MNLRSNHYMRRGGVTDNTTYLGEDNKMTHVTGSVLSLIHFRKLLIKQIFTGNDREVCVVNRLENQNCLVIACQ